MTDTPANPIAPIDSRESERVTINKEFSSFDEFLQEYVTNISRSGVFIKTKSPLPVGTVVNLHFTVIMEGIETVEGTGEVTRLAEGGMGVVFREISNYSKAIIERLLLGQAKATSSDAREKAPG
jgi:hypothetical protein